jgi:hypothetical protein
MDAIFGLIWILVGGGWAKLLFVLNSFQFDHAGQFANGLAPARNGNESGFIDNSGKFVFHLNFSYSDGFFGSKSSGLFIADNDVARYWTDNGFNQSIPKGLYCSPESIGSDWL